MYYIILATSIGVLLKVEMPPSLALLFLALAAICVFQIHDRYLQNKKRKQDSKRIDNIYVVEIPPSKGIDLPFGKDRFGAPLIYFAKHGQVGDILNQRKEEIEDSGNDREVLYLSWFFQDGEHINETEEEYANRIIEDIKFDRALKHGKISEEDRAFYVEQQLQDNQFEWEQES